MDEKYIESMDAAAAAGMLHICFSQHADVIIYLFSTISITDVLTYHGMQKEHDWLPEGWWLEIRAGVENKDKAYKVVFVFTPIYNWMTSRKMSARGNQNSCSSKSVWVVLVSIKY